MQSLKFHPRDALPNATALARAEAVYAELTRVRRRDFGELIAAFRAVLEGQAPQEIEVMRQVLIRATEELSRPGRA